MRVTVGVVLKTKNDGRAEIEFENGSVVRIAPDTKLTFTELSLRDSGVRLSTINVDEGLAYVRFNGHKDDEFTVNFAHESARPVKDAHFRLEVTTLDANLAVFDGDVPVSGASGNFEVEKKHTATFNLTDSDRYELAKKIEEDPYDAWDREQMDFHERYRASKSYSDYPYSYGVSDLNYYGNYFSVPGYGMVWQPYFAGAGWNPWMDGAWLWYPGFGYTWVSSYPWGWMPYRYGGWAFAPGYGWFWQPGGWNNWYTAPRVVNPPNRFRTPQPPPNRTTTVVSVGRGPVTGTTNIPPRRVTISRDSAGFGLSRGSVNDLRKVAKRVSNEGAVTVRTRPAPVAVAPSTATTGPSTGPSRTATGSTSRPNSGSRTSSPSMRVPSSGGGRSASPSRSAPPHR